MIYVGGVLGGPERDLERVSQAMATINLPGAQDADVDSAHATKDEPGSLDIVFHFPGSVWKPDYTGVRCGRLSRKQRILQVQIAVPEMRPESEEMRAFLLRSSGLVARGFGGQEFRFRRVGTWLNWRG